MSTNFEDLILRDITGNRPAAAIPGRLFYDTTLEKWERDTGAAWEDCEPAAGGSGDVLGPATNTDGNIPQWDGTDSKTLKNGLGLVTTVGTPGADTNVPSEAAVRTAIGAVSGGAMVLLASETKANDNDASFDFSGLSGSYRHLLIFLMGRGDTNAAAVVVDMTFNNDTGNNYTRAQYYNGAGTGADDLTAQANMAVGVLPAATAAANVAGAMEIMVFKYAGTTFYKGVRGLGADLRGTAAGNNYVQMMAGQWESTSAITRVTISVSAGKFKTGSDCAVYGIT